MKAVEEKEREKKKPSPSNKHVGFIFLGFCVQYRSFNFFLLDFPQIAPKKEKKISQVIPNGFCVSRSVSKNVGCCFNTCSDLFVGMPILKPISRHLISFSVFQNKEGQQKKPKQNWCIDLDVQSKISNLPIKVFCGDAGALFVRCWFFFLMYQLMIHGCA